MNTLNSLENLILITLCLLLCGYLFWSLRRYARLKAREETTQESLDIAIQELQHRVRNNLQVVNSLVQLQTVEAVQRGAEVAAQNIAYRIRAVSAAQEITAQHNSDQISGLELVQRVIAIHFPKMNASESSSATVWLTPKQATATALIVNEVLLDAKRHETQAVGARIVVQGEQVELTLTTDSTETGATGFFLDSLTTQIIATLVTHDLAGTYRVIEATGQFELCFPQSLAVRIADPAPQPPKPPTGRHRKDLRQPPATMPPTQEAQETRIPGKNREMRRI